jgi:hypothetical protein
MDWIASALMEFRESFSGESATRNSPTNDIQILLQGLLSSENSPTHTTNQKKKQDVSKMVSIVSDSGDQKISDHLPPLPESGTVAVSTEMQSTATTESISVAKGSKMKNDKAVEVYHETTLLARFRTQTECARYLRATPEAVSYHCSKGGGSCNGLKVKPLTGVHADDPENDLEDDWKKGSFFGLFAGSTEHRPAARPQISPENVVILKEWILSPEHIDNPYPNGRDYEMLMKKTKLDKSQIKHWFNNARKRILKPLLQKNGTEGAALAIHKKRNRRANDDDDADGAEALASMKKSGRKPRKIDKTNSGDLSGATPSTSNLSGIPFQPGGNMMLNQFTGFSNNQYTGFSNNQYLMNMMMMRGQGNVGSNSMMMGGYGGDGMIGGFASMIGGASSQGMNPMTMNPMFGGTSGGGHGFQGVFKNESAAASSSSNFDEDLTNTESLSASASIPSSEVARSNAMFKQQVAAMAMNEASTAFREMEEAHARAKELATQNLKRKRPNDAEPDDEDMELLEANTHAKKCQSLAMFKLKVSQRASEEAKFAYDLFERSRPDGGEEPSGSRRSSL